MNIIINTLLLILALCPFISQAQSIDNNALGYYIDALKYTQVDASFGSARLQALGGAQTALGADITNVNGNPAGLGMIRNSFLSISPAFSITHTNALYRNTVTNESKFGFNLPNLGGVMSLRNRSNPNGDWKHGGIGFSMSQTKNFRQKLVYEGNNPQNSLADFMIERAQGIDASVFEDESVNNEILDLPSLAYATYVINPYADEATDYYTEFRNENNELLGSIKQRETKDISGSVSELKVAYGASYKDKIYLGASLGFSFLEYKLNNEFKENLLLSEEGIPDANLSSFTLREELDVSGAGINFSLGVIFKLTDWMRIGASAVTPTFLFLDENYAASLSANFKGLAGESRSMLPLTNAFSITTPFKISFGMAFFYQKWGFLTFDADYIDYSAMVLKGENGQTFDADNRTISAIYQPAYNFRLGLEGRYKIFRLRGGFGYYGNPVKIDIGANLPKETLHVSGGLGIHLSDYFIDVAFIQNLNTSGLSPYTLSNYEVSSVDIERRYSRLIFTLGAYF